MFEGCAALEREFNEAKEQTESGKEAMLRRFNGFAADVSKSLELARDYLAHSSFYNMLFIVSTQSRELQFAGAHVNQ